jgi:hypothetical protein
MSTTNLLLMIAVTANTFAWAFVVRRWAWPRLSALPTAAALEPILALHTFRALGLAFLTPGVVGAGLDPAFAAGAAWGDVAAAALAALALSARGTRAFTPLAWAFMLWGSYDLLSAMANGIRLQVAAHLGATWFIPALVVPMLLVTQAAGFVLLLRAARQPAARAVALHH